MTRYAGRGALPLEVATSDLASTLSSLFKSRQTGSGTRGLLGIPDAAAITTIGRVSIPVNESRAGGSTLVGLRFELFVQDVERSVRFYSSTLGLKPPATWSPDGYVSISAGVVTIGVQQRANLPAGHHFSPSRLAGPRGVGLEIVVEVDDVDLAYSNAAPHAERCGGSVEPLNDQPWGLRDFRLIDPDGYYVRVTSHRR